MPCANPLDPICDSSCRRTSTLRSLSPHLVRIPDTPSDCVAAACASRWLEFGLSTERCCQPLRRVKLAGKETVLTAMISALGVFQAAQLTVPEGWGGWPRRYECRGGCISADGAASSNTKGRSEVCPPNDRTASLTLVSVHCHGRQPAPAALTDCTYWFLPPSRWKFCHHLVPRQQPSRRSNCARP